MPHVAFTTQNYRPDSYGAMVDPLMELSTASAVRSAVAAVAGPAVLSNLAVRDDIASGRLVEVRVRGQI